MSALIYYPFDGSKPRSVYSSQPVPGAWNELVDWLSGDDEAEADLYTTVDMYTDEDSVEVVFYDGEPIGVLDNEHIGKSDLDRFETIEQMELREGREDAERELRNEIRAEWKGERAND